MAKQAAKVVASDISDSGEPFRLRDAYDHWSATFSVDASCGRPGTKRKPRSKSETIYTEFGKRLKRLRGIRGLTQDALGEKLKELGIINPTGRPNVYASRLESGNYMANLELISALCEVLKCSPNDLIPPLF